MKHHNSNKPGIAVRFGDFALVIWIVLLIAGMISPGFAQDELLPSADSTAAVQQQAPSAQTLQQHLNDRRENDTTDWGARLISLLGMVVLLGLAWLLSEDKRKIPWKLVAWGMGLQLIFALLILKTVPGQWFFQQLTDAVNVILGFTEEGARFIFGGLVANNVPVGTPLGDPSMGPVPAEGATQFAHIGAYFAFFVLPTIIFFSSLMSLLYHLGIMQAFVKAVAWVMQRTMKTSGAETLSVAANIFVGQTEAPLMIRPYVNKMTQSELMAVMTGGFATIAGGVMAAYVGMLRHVFPDIAGHLIAASVMSAPAALVVAKIMIPEREQSMTTGTVRLKVEKDTVNVVDAAAQGASVGLKLALNVGAMLLAFISLLAMANYLVGAAAGWFGAENVTLQLLMGYLYWPIAWVMGIPSGECLLAGQLLAERVVLNEFVSYLHLSSILTTDGSGLSYRSMVILIYALCGFANFGSIAIQLGGIGGIAPDRRKDLARVGMRAMIAGLIATHMTATIAGILL